MTKLIRLLTLISILTTSSCATLITASMPPYTIKKKGKIKTSKVASYDFFMVPYREYKYKVIQLPICSVEQRIYLVKKKQTRGAIVALLELPLFGLGLADWVIADTMAQNSKEIVDRGYIPTGEFKECGNTYPAQDTSILIQFPLSMKIKKVTTDKRGILDLEDVIVGHHHLYINLFVKREGKIYYLTSMYFEG